MQDEQRVLACVDQSPYADHVADYAVWAAQRLQSPLELLHVIDRHPEVARLTDDYSGAIGIDAQENLLQTLSDQDEAYSRSAREAGRLFLNRLRERGMAMGAVTPDVRLRHGELEQALVDLQDDVRLFVLGRRGRSAATTQRDLGRNLERVVRALRKPILTVTEGFRVPSRVMIAFDGSSVTRRGVEMVATSPLLRGLPILLLMSGKPGAEARRHLAWARERLDGAGFEAEASLQPGDAETTIARTALERDVDLLVMGAYAHSPLRRLFLGSKTTDLLRASRMPVILLR